MDSYRIDGHKLYWHLDRVHEWQQGKTTAPIYIEVSPVGYCNHNCIFCGVDFAKDGLKLDADVFCKQVEKMGALGLRSIMFAGEGEPLLHPELPRIVAATKRAGIDVGITSNGHAKDTGVWKELLPHLTWIKFSVDAGTADVFAKVHGVSAKFYDKVVANIAAACEEKKKANLGVTLGAQFLIIDENKPDVDAFLEFWGRIGLDYLVLKPYSLHPQMIRKMDTVYNDELRADVQNLVNKHVARSETRIIFREGSFDRYRYKERSYEHCYALPFWGYVDAHGDFYTCSVFIGDDRFKAGSIYEHGVEQLFFGPMRKDSIFFARNELSVQGECRYNCRMARINEFLEFLVANPQHVNFI